MLCEVMWKLWPKGHGHAFQEFSKRHHDYAIVATFVNSQGVRFSHEVVGDWARYHSLKGQGSERHRQILEHVKNPRWQRATEFCIEEAGQLCAFYLRTVPPGYGRRRILAPGKPRNFENCCYRLRCILKWGRYKNGYNRPFCAVSSSLSDTLSC